MTHQERRALVLDLVAQARRAETYTSYHAGSGHYLRWYRTAQRLRALFTGERS